MYPNAGGGNDPRVNGYASYGAAPQQQQQQQPQQQQQQHPQQQQPPLPPPQHGAPAQQQAQSAPHPTQPPPLASHLVPPSVATSSFPSNAGSSTTASWYPGHVGGRSDGDASRLPSLVSQVPPLEVGSNHVGNSHVGTSASANPSSNAYGIAYHAAPPTTAVPPQLAAAPQPYPTSRTGIIAVYDVGPLQGPEGTVIRINCDLNFPPAPQLEAPGQDSGNRVRILFGNLAIETKVELPPPDSVDQSYLVTAAVPSSNATSVRGSTPWNVPIFLEAITKPYGIAESLGLGEFRYTAAEVDAGGSTPKRARRRLDMSGSASPKKMTMRRRREDEPSYPPPTAIPAGATASFVYDSPPLTPQPGLIRTTQMMPSGSQPSPYVVRSKARLEVQGDLLTMKMNWSPEMWSNRRCLVRFSRRQVGSVVHASFSAVEEKDWTPNMIVISCLYHDARNECYFTSVDVIYLLECLMTTRYTTEEKNRIRRNLESFKPTTLQKNEGQWQDFYAHIMNYPNPKPRNIDKGLKVFPWAHLEQALKKIFGNYSAYLTTPFTGVPGAIAAPHMAEDQQHVTYAHNALGASDSLSYVEDRRSMTAGHPTMAHHAHSHAPSTSISGNSDEQGGYHTSPASPGFHRPELLSSASAYGALDPGPQGEEFGNYVNMSPAVTPSGGTPYPTAGQPVNATPHMGGVGYPAVGGDQLSHPPGVVYPAPPGYAESQSHLPYTHIPGSRGASSQDLRVSYDARQHPPNQDVFPPA